MQSSADDNPVVIDVERAEFSENAVMYELRLDRVGGRFKHLMELLYCLRD